MADDLVQDTIEKALRNSARFEEGTNMRAWLFQIMKNTYLGEIRKMRAMRSVSMLDDEFIASVMPIIAPDQEAVILMHEIEHAINGLPAERKVVMAMSVFHGMEPGEISQKTGVNYLTVKSRLHRGRLALADVFQHHGFKTWRSYSERERVTA